MDWFTEKHEGCLSFLLGLLFPPTWEKGLTQDQVDFMLAFMEAVRNETIREKFPVVQFYESYFNDYLFFKEEEIQEEFKHKEDIFFSDLETIPDLVIEE